MDKGLGRGEGITWMWDFLAHLPGEVDTRAVFLLRAMDANIVFRNPGPWYAPVCGLHQSDGDPTRDVYARPGVGLTPL